MREWRKGGEEKWKGKKEEVREGRGRGCEGEVGGKGLSEEED